MNKKFLLLILVMLMPLGISQDINLTSFGGDDNKINYIEDTNTLLEASHTYPSENYLELNISHNTLQDYKIKNYTDVSQDFNANLDLYDIPDGNLTATATINALGGGLASSWGFEGLDNAGNKQEQTFEVLEDTKLIYAEIDRVFDYYTDCSQYKMFILVNGTQEAYKQSSCSNSNYYIDNLDLGLKDGDILTLRLQYSGGNDDATPYYRSKDEKTVNEFKSLEFTQYFDLDGSGTVYGGYVIDSKLKTATPESTDSKNASKDTELNYNLSSDLNLNWNFAGRETVFYDDVISEAYTIDYTLSPEANYLNISTLRPNEIFGYVNDNDSNINYYNTNNESINASQLSTGEIATKSFDVRFSDIPTEFWDNMTDNATNSVMTLNLVTRSLDEDGILQATYQIDEQKAFDLPKEGLLAVISRAVSGFFDSILNVLNPLFDLVLSILGWLFEALVFIITAILDIIVVVISVLAQIILDVVGFILTIFVNFLQMITFWHTNTAIEYDNTTYNNFSEANASFTDVITGNFTFKSNTTKAEYFDEGVISDRDWSLKSHNKRYELYGYDLIALQQSSNYTDSVPSTGVNNE